MIAAVDLRSYCSFSLCPLDCSLFCFSTPFVVLVPESPSSLWRLKRARLVQTKSPPRTNVGAGLIFAYTARGTTLIGSALSSNLSAGFPLYRHGTHSLFQDSSNKLS